MQNLRMTRFVKKNFLPTLFVLAAPLFLGCRGSTENASLSSNASSGSMDEKLGAKAEGQPLEKVKRLSNALSLVRYGDSEDANKVNQHFYLRMKMTEESLLTSLEVTDPLVGNPASNPDSSSDTNRALLSLQFEARVADTSADQLGY